MQSQQEGEVISLAERYFASAAFDSFVAESIAFVQKAERYVRKQGTKMNRGATFGPGLNSTYIRESVRLMFRVSKASTWLILLQMRARGELSNEEFAKEFMRRVVRCDSWRIRGDDIRLCELPLEFVVLVHKSQQLIVDLRRLSTQFGLYV